MLLIKRMKYSYFHAIFLFGEEKTNKNLDQINIKRIESVFILHRFVCDWEIKIFHRKIENNFIYWKKTKSKSVNQSISKSLIFEIFVLGWHWNIATFKYFSVFVQMIFVIIQLFTWINEWKKIVPWHWSWAHFFDFILVVHVLFYSFFVPKWKSLKILSKNNFTKMTTNSIN